MNGGSLRRLAQEARRVIDKCSVQNHPLLFQHGMLVAVVCFTALVTNGEWLEQNDMYCLRRIDLEELSQDHQDWGRCERNFYSTALQNQSLPHLFHPWLYNKLRMSVHVYAAIGLLFISQGVWLIFQNERAVKARRDFQGCVHRNDSATRWRKRQTMAEMLQHNGSLGLYAGNVAIALFFLVLDIILLACVLLTYNPWSIKVHLGKRNILDPRDIAIISFPPLTWCDVSQETGRLEGTYSYNCEVAANNTYVLIAVFLAASLTSMLLKTVMAVLHCVLVINMPFWRRGALGIKKELPTDRTIDLYYLGHYTTLRGFRTAFRKEVRGRQDRKVIEHERPPAIYH